VSKPEAKAEPKPEAHTEPVPDAKAETKPEPTAKPAAEVSPQLVQRVHEFYEQLGSEDVRAVQASDLARPKAAKAEVVK
jgi:hypothetical protein